MNKKIVLSNAPHSVTFNEVTHNAVRPQNDIIESDRNQQALKPCESDTVALVYKPEESITENSCNPHIETNHSKFASETIADKKTYIGKRSKIKKNIQKIIVQSPLDDNLYRESLQKLKDQIQHLKEIQTSDNRQSFENSAYSSNIQYITNQEKIEKKLVYLEKQNIQDHLESADTTKKLTPVVSFQTYPDLHQISEVAITPAQIENATGQVEPQVQILEINNVNEMQDCVEGHLLHKSSDESELQAQIRLMKQKLHKANQDLIDIQDGDLHI